MMPAQTGFMPKVISACLVGWLTAAIAKLYTKSAAYLAPKEDIQTGKQIEANFGRFFRQIQERGNSVAISFRIVQRQVQSALAYDVGIYTSTITAADGSSRQEQGTAGRRVQRP